MVIGTLLFLTASLDAGGWHTYAPKDSGLRFAMPGTVRADSKADATGGAKTLFRYRSVSEGIEYTVVYGEPADQFKAAVEELWAKARFGETVKSILGNTLAAAAKAGGDKIVKSSFGKRDGFPGMTAVMEHGNGLGSVSLAVFTKRGIVVMGTRIPTTRAGCDAALKFIDTLDLSGRK